MTNAGGYPLLLQPHRATALVVGGGSVAERKVLALRTGAMRVRVVASKVTPTLSRLAADGELEILMRDFHARDVRGARLVFAATDDAEVNAAVAAAAREAGALVNIADDPAASDFVTPAVHRSGPLVVAVNAGGVPGAAARIRDAIAVRFGEGYATALERLGEIRARYLADADREGWQSASSVLIGEDFCEAVESGRFEREVAAWR